MQWQLQQELLLRSAAAASGSLAEQPACAYLALQETYNESGMATAVGEDITGAAFRATCENLIGPGAEAQHARSLHSSPAADLEMDRCVTGARPQADSAFEKVLLSILWSPGVFSNHMLLLLLQATCLLIGLDLKLGLLIQA